MSWSLLALLQVAVIAMFLFASAVMVRRARQARLAAPASEHAGRSPSAEKHAPASELALLRDSLGTLRAKVEDSREGWRRVRQGLHTVLAGAQPIMAHSSWDELHRLLCAADKLLGISSPPIEYREDKDDGVSGEGDIEDRWRALVRGLQELHAAVTHREEAALDDEQAAALLGGMLVAVDELRVKAPDATKQHESGREAELRKMILQFTYDSRDMLSCIRRLESENANLRTQLGVVPAEA